MVTHGLELLVPGMSQHQESGQSPTMAQPSVMQVVLQKPAMIFPKEKTFSMEKESIPHLPLMLPQTMLGSTNMLEEATKWFFRTVSGGILQPTKLDMGSIGCLHVTGISVPTEYA